MPATIQPPRQVRPVPTDVNDWSNTAMVTIATAPPAGAQTLQTF